MNRHRLAALTACMFLASSAVAADTAPDGASPAGIIAANLDPAVRPQDDLFRAVNGTWLTKTDIPPDKASYGYDAILTDQNLEWLKTIVAEAAAAGAAPGSEAQKVGDLYAAYMDEAAIEKAGMTPLEPELAKIEALSARAQLPALLAHLQLIGVDTPFDIYIHQDAKDPTHYILDLGQSGLGLPDRDFYLLKDQRFVGLRRAYTDYVTRLLTLAGDPAAGAEAARLMAFETRLAQAQWDKVKNRDPVKTYNPRTAAALARNAPAFAWKDWFAGLGIAGQTVTVSQPSYLHAQDTILAHTDLATLKLYLRLRLLDAYAPYLAHDFDEANFAFHRGALRGIKEQPPRWKRGIRLLDESIGEALGKLYVAQHFSPEAKARVEQLVKNLLAAYAVELDHLDWMSDATRQKAKEKLAKFTYKIGYPDRWRDYSTLDIKAGDLVGDVERAQEFETRRNLAKLGKPIDRSEWGMTPQTVNAYYNPEQNEVVFPAAILQPPYFDPNVDDAVNYGSTGGTIGHELTHGFDDEGSQYDGDGALRAWWTPQDRKRFDALGARLAAQYDAYEPVKGVHINGKLTLGENIADLGGLTIAYKAYCLSLGGQPAPVLDGLSGAQRFFYGYAMSWMEKARDESLVTQLKSDPHAPPEYRTNGVVRNMDSYHEAFATRPGDKLYAAPAERLRIW